MELCFRCKQLGQCEHFTLVLTKFLGTKTVDYAEYEASYETLATKSFPICRRCQKNCWVPRWIYYLLFVVLLIACLAILFAKNRDTMFPVWLIGAAFVPLAVGFFLVPVVHGEAWHYMTHRRDAVEISIAPIAYPSLWASSCGEFVHGPDSEGYPRPGDTILFTTLSHQQLMERSRNQR